MDTLDLAEWVAKGDARHAEFRRAVHTILDAIANAPSLPNLMILKGAVLLSIRYGGDRHTTDIDFSTSKMAREVDIKELISELNDSLAMTVEKLDYQLDCRIQSYELRPPDMDKSFQTLKLNVGYAPKHVAKRHRRLLDLRCSTVAQIDLSFNEMIVGVEACRVDGVASIYVYGLADIVAEKLRAILQQPIRNRFRRQDAYDLYQLTKKVDLSGSEIRKEILWSLLEKSSARKLEVNSLSMRNEEVRRRSSEEYAGIQAEISGELPAFETVFEAVQGLYEGLPWENSKP